VSSRITALTLTVAIVLCSALSACAPEAPKGSSGSGSITSPGISLEQTGTAEQGSSAVAPGDSEAGDGSDATGSDAKALDQQLDAMQRELVSLAMPSDDDFGAAENSLY